MECVGFFQQVIKIVKFINSLKIPHIEKGVSRLRVKWICNSCKRIVECNGKYFVETPNPFLCDHVCHFCIFGELNKINEEQVEKIDCCERKIIKEYEMNPSYRHGCVIHE